MLNVFEQDDRELWRRLRGFLGASDWATAPSVAWPFVKADEPNATDVKRFYERAERSAYQNSTASASVNATAESQELHSVRRRPVVQWRLENGRTMA